MKTTFAALFTFISLILFSLTVYAFNFSFMENSPAFYFKGDDLKIMENSAVKALDSGKDGQKINWKNPDTSAFGYFIISGTHTQDGARCRNMKSFLSVEGVTNMTNYKFCKIKNDWRIVN